MPLARLKKRCRLLAYLHVVRRHARLRRATATYWPSFSQLEPTRLTYRRHTMFLRSKTILQSIPLATRRSTTVVASG